MRFYKKLMELFFLVGIWVLIYPRKRYVGLVIQIGFPAPDFTLFIILPWWILVQVFLFQKAALYKCNMAGKPAVLTRVVDSMTDNLRPTRAEATDVANAVLDGMWVLLLWYFLNFLAEPTWFGRCYWNGGGKTYLWITALVVISSSYLSSCRKWCNSSWCWDPSRFVPCWDNINCRQDLCWGRL